MSDKKYTAQEWAAMYGGHSAEEKKSSLQLVNELTESRLFRNKKIASSVNVDDASDLAFMYLMLLNVFNKDYDYAPLAGEYAKRTGAFKNFDTFRTSGTDLYVALNRLMGKDQEYDNEKDQIAISRTKPMKSDIIQYLNHIGSNKTNPQYEQKMLMRFQRQFNVQDGMLKSMRRLVGDWDNLNQNQRALIVTRGVQFMRSKAPRSELMQALLKFQRRGNFVVDDSKDKKKKIWNNPIVKGAAIAGAIYGAGRLGKELGKSTYSKPISSKPNYQPRHKK